MAFVSTQDKLTILSDKREKYINAKENSWNEEKGDYDYNPEEAIDHLEDAINKMIRDNYLSLPFDIILEELTKLGGCPSLIYDDAGHWAIPSINFGSAVLDEAEDNSITFFIEKKDWFDTPREALENYLSY